MNRNNYSLWDDIVARVALDNNLDLAMDLINAALEAEGSKVKIVEVETQKAQNDLEAKGVVMDALARDEAGNLYQIEIQNEHITGLEERLALGDSYLVRMALLRGESHDEMRNHTVIAFCNFRPSVTENLPVYHAGE